MPKRKYAEEHLAHLQDLNHRIVTGSSMGILAYQLTGPCILANEAAARVVGASKEGLLRQDFRKLESWRQSGLLDMAEEAIASGNAVQRELPVTSSFGKQTWLKCDFSLFEYGNEKALLLLVEDITERKIVQRSYEREVERYKALMGASIDGLHVLDSEGHLEDANPAFLSMLGYTKEELLGRHVSAWSVRSNREELHAALAETKAKRSNQVLETKHRRKDGSIFDVEVSISFVDINGQLYSYAVARDISKRKVALRRIERLTQMYAVVFGTNRAIVRAHSEEELYGQLSRLAFGVVVRIADADGILHAVAYSESLRSVARIEVRTTDPSLPESQTYVAIAYRENRIVINNDVAADERPRQWQTVLHAEGVRSIAAIPIRRHGKPIGVFVLNTMEMEFFDAEMSADFTRRVQEKLRP